MILSYRPRRPKPLKIGISPRLFHPQPGAVGLQSKPLLYLEDSIARWVMSRDVMVFMIPTLTRDAQLKRGDIRLLDYAEHLDGLLLQGGADLSPTTYGEQPLKPEWGGDKVRDDFETELLMEFVEAGKPVLGICRGAQLINVAFGGTLYQDIATQKENAIAHVHDIDYDRHSHEIRFEPKSKMAKLFSGMKVAQVTSIHHQAVRTIGRDLTVEAWSIPDDLPEAIRLQGKSYVVGLQWHPEFHYLNSQVLLNCEPILEEFLNEARRRS